jgi:hypothetical protein
MFCRFMCQATYLSLPLLNRPVNLHSVQSISESYRGQLGCATCGGEVAQTMGEIPYHLAVLDT